MSRHKLGTILFGKFSQLVVPAEKPDYPEHNQHDPDYLHNYECYYRIKKIFQSMHNKALAPERYVGNIFEPESSFITIAQVERTCVLAQIRILFKYD